MTGEAYRCISQLSEARRLYDQGQYPECLDLIEKVSRCTNRCGDDGACSAALRVVSKGMGLDRQQLLP
jgi:hypothetical protein